MNVNAQHQETVIMRPPRIPYVVGTDITNLKRWNFASSPNKYVAIARKIINPFEARSLYQIKPHIAEALFPQVFLNLDCSVVKEDGTFSYAKFLQAVKISQSQVITSEKYQQLVKSPVVQSQASQYLAGRWAAKEAAKKTWGPDWIGWQDLSLLMPTKGHPGMTVRLSPVMSVATRSKLAPDVAKEGLVQLGALSISHDGDYCIATVIAEPLNHELSVYYQGCENIQQMRDKRRRTEPIAREDESLKVDDRKMADELEEIEIGEVTPAVEEVQSPIKP